MKALIFVFLLLTGTYALCETIDTVKTQTSISDVTVFFNGAQITRSGQINFSAGKHIIVLEGLPVELNPQSIQVHQIENCQILSVKHNVKTNNTKSDNVEIKDIESKIDLKNKRLNEIRNEISVYDIEEKLMLDNARFGRKEEVNSITEIKEAADFYRLRLNEIRKAKMNLTYESENIKEEINTLYIKANEINAKSLKSHSVILIAIDCKVKTKSELKLTYYTPSAGWDPLYDFRVEDITKPLSVVYNADVYQSTGEDWKDVNIRLSTSNPALSGTKPELQTWYIDKRKSYEAQPKYSGAGNGSLSGFVYDKNSNEPLAFVNLEILMNEQLVSGCTTDMDGKYTIKPLPAGIYSLRASYIGYEMNTITNIYVNDNKNTFANVTLNPTTAMLAEVNIVEYRASLINKDSQSINSIPSDYIMHGSRSYSENYYIDGETDNKEKREIITTDYIANSLGNPVANLEYIIEIPYSVPSDGQNYSMKIKEVSLPVNYIYHVVPKLDEDVFLSAEIIDRSELNLLSGKAGIYYQGTFTGETYIDVNTVSDTLNISLGRDNSIIVKREGNKELNDKRYAGNYIKQTVAWNITLKNNKDTNVKVFVYDQFPVSERKSVEIERLDFSGAKVEEKTGKITWKLELEPNERKELKTAFSVKYPKYETLYFD